MRGLLCPSTLVLTGALLPLGCDSKSGVEPGQCESVVDSVTSPSPGFAMLHGEFHSNESVIIQESDGTVIAEGTPQLRPKHLHAR